MKREDYDGLTREQLIERLMAAERVCVVNSWTAGADTDREKAVYMLWLEWLEVAGRDMSSPKRHPELNDGFLSMLAVERDRRREVTLARIRGESS